MKIDPRRAAGLAVAAVALVAVVASAPALAPTAPVAADDGVYIVENGDTIYVPEGVTGWKILSGTPTPTPVPSPSPTPTPSPSPSPSAAPPSPTPMPTPSPTPIPTPTPVPTPSVSPSIAPCPPNLQAAINGAASGGTLNITGCAYSGSGFTITKRMTIIGGTINSTATSGNVMTVTATGDGAIVDGLRVNGGFIGVAIDQADGATVRNSTVTNVKYAGIMTIGATNGVIRSNTVDGVVPSNPDPDWNAYGIVATFLGSSGNSTDILIENNTVRNIPTWHGLDTHAGVRIIFRGNTTSGVRRGVFLTSGPTAALVESNTLTAPTTAQQAACPAGAPPTYCTDIRGISVSGGTGTIRNNTGINWPAGRWWNPISGGAGYSTPGNNPAIP